MPYESVFDLAKQAANGLGGKLKTEDLGAGSIQYKFKYGFNPTGILVDIQFRRTTEGSTEAAIRGRIGGSFDTTGAGKARAHAVLNELARRLETTPKLESPAENVSTAGPGSPAAMSAPFVGDATVSHRGKSRTTTALLAPIVFFGGIGVHRFYLGTWGWGIVYIALLLVGNAIGLTYAAAFLGVCESIRYFIMKQPDFDANYNYLTVKPFSFRFERIYSAVTRALIDGAAVGKHKVKASIVPA